MQFKTPASRRAAFANMNNREPRLPNTTHNPYSYKNINTNLPNNNIKINWMPLSDSDSIVLMSPTEYIERIGIVNRLGSKEAVEEREKSAREKGYPGILHYPGYSKESVKSIIRGYKEGKEIYMPQIMYDKKGLVDDQEGYHRAIAAIEMNIKQIPVAIYGDMPLKYEKTHDYRKEIKMLGDQS